VLEDWRTAPVDERLRAALSLVEKLTLRPDELGPDDLAPLRGHGLGDEAIEDVVTVTAAFNTIDRIADALGFEIPPPAGVAASVKQLLTRGYK
jgi:alkylhydroperoxidase family enzyme